MSSPSSTSAFSSFSTSTLLQSPAYIPSHVPSFLPITNLLNIPLLKNLASQIYTIKQSLKSTQLYYGLYRDNFYGNFAINLNGKWFAFNNQYSDIFNKSTYTNIPTISLHNIKKSSITYISHNTNITFMLNTNIPVLVVYSESNILAYYIILPESYTKYNFKTDFLSNENILNNQSNISGSGTPIYPLI